MTSSTSAPDLSTFSRAGLTFDVQDGGPRDGAVVVLLHGFPQDSSSWELVAPRLHDAGLRTLAPDQRGYSPGASPREVSAYRGPELVADVLALMDAAGAERVHLVGHDWGGAVAWLVAQRAPHRLASSPSCPPRTPPRSRSPCGRRTSCARAGTSAPSRSRACQSSCCPGG